MKTQRLATCLTVINLVLLVFLLTQIRRAGAQDVAPVLRGRALEIVDAQGRVRADIAVYSETVLLRMGDQNRRPVVKLTASEKGATLGLSDDAQGRAQLSARGDIGNFLKIVNRDGREQVIKP